MSIWPFGRSPDRDLAERILARVIAASRSPAFYGAGRVDDTLEGRFEILTLHAILAIVRMGKTPEMFEVSQVLTDRFFSQLDAGLREHGLSDTAVPWRMHALAAAFYHRLGAYGGALADGEALEQALSRNVFGPEGRPFAVSLANHMGALFRLQDRQDPALLAEAEAWPDPVV